MKNQKGFAPIILLLLIVVLGVGGFFGWQYGWRYYWDYRTVKYVEDLTKHPEKAVFLKGKVQSINKDLGLFTANREEAIVSYYDAGEMPNGKYNGYKRLLAIAPEKYTDTCNSAFFITNDDVHYKIGFNSFYSSNKDKVEYTDDIDQDFLAYEAGTVPTGETGYMNIVNEPLTRFDKQKCTLITSTNNMLSLGTVGGDIPVFRENVLKNKIVSDGSVIAQDPTGILFKGRFYETINDSMKGEDSVGLRLYSNNLRVKNVDKFYTDSFDNNNAPNYMLGLDTSVDLGNYPEIIPDFSQLSDSDFIQVDSFNNKISVYALKEPISENIYRTRFKKMDRIKSSAAGDFNAPTYQKYTSKYPFVFIKDPWGQFVLLEEAHYARDNFVGG